MSIHAVLGSALGIATASGLTPPGKHHDNTAEVRYPNGVVFQSTTRTAGRDLLCGLNVRFAVDPTQSTCAALNADFTMLSPLFAADTDVGGATYAAGVGLQDFAMEYQGNMRRILTVAVVDDRDALNVLNFRQFLIEMSPSRRR